MADNSPGWGSNDISKRPEDQKKGMDAMAEGRKKRQLSDDEFYRLARDDRVGALEFFATDLAVILRKRLLAAQRGGDDLTATDINLVKEFRQTIEALERYLGMRTEDEAAADFFADLQERIQPAITNLSIDKLPKIILDQLESTNSRTTEPPTGEAG